MRHAHLLPVLLIASCTHSTPPPEPAGVVSTNTRAATTKRASLEERMVQLREEAMASRGSVDFVRALTRDVGARLAGSPNDAKAVEWAEKRLTALGFANVHREPAMVPHWERGPISGAIVAKGKRTPLDLIALGNSGSTPKKGALAAVVRVESLAAAEALGPKELAGKILFFDMPMERVRDGSSYARIVSARNHGSTVAAERGAAAMIIRSLSSDPSVPHTGNTEHGGLPSVALSGVSADALRDALASDPKTKVQLEVSNRKHPDAQSYNVVGEIKGTDRAEEVVLLGAHLDSWDVGEGAADDGAGCAIVAEAARLVAKHAPRRTVRVVLFASEEQDFPGGKAYAKAHESEIDKIVVALEADAGEGRAVGFRAAVGPEGAQAVQRTVGFLAPLGVELLPGEAHGGTDVTPLHEKGVPIFQVKQDGIAYFDMHHSQNDVFERLDQSALVQVTAAYAIATYSAAESEGLGRITVKSSEHH